MEERSSKVTGRSGWVFMSGHVRLGKCWQISQRGESLEDYFSPSTKLVMLKDSHFMANLLDAYTYRQLSLPFQPLPTFSLPCRLSPTVPFPCCLPPPYFWFFFTFMPCFLLIHSHFPYLEIIYVTELFFSLYFHHISNLFTVSFFFYIYIQRQVSVQI